ncbi:hypothetical protein [Chondromyces apiculatus]|uniref:Uncharacterized protein n=1 Tax=Chondromyces apiculatus DSM 436 TaxID=1192034 RepID=A0A017TD58_9BACT|nr:hypothetical protein [Chondromyces apiculatus]EYF06755.1 Hypothetical protein CAP_1452 [Chondromyces apiculatus DSM 436]
MTPSKVALVLGGVVVLGVGAAVALVFTLDGGPEGPDPAWSERVPFEAARWRSAGALERGAMALELKRTRALEGRRIAEVERELGRAQRMPGSTHYAWSLGKREGGGDPYEELLVASVDEEGVIRSVLIVDDEGE